jgi:hypothetical protein
MKKEFFLAAAFVFTLVFTGNAATVYNVNRTIGAGSVTGTIETDGTTGLLSAANITDWNLLLNDSTATFNLFGPLSGNNSSAFVAGNDFTATTTELLFDFSGADHGLLLFQQGLFSGNHYYCDGTAGNSACFVGETVTAISVSSHFELANPSGSQVIGTAQGTSPVPEPAPMILLAPVLLGFALLRAGRKGSLVA